MVNRIFCLKIKIVFFLLMTSLIGKAQKPAHSLDKEISAIFSEWNQSGSPGGAVAVVQNDKVLYTNGFGSANLENNTPITSTTKFQLRALQNQIVAFAVLLLESKGKLSLSDDIRKYLPEMPAFEKPILIHHLLTHTHGITDFVSIQLLSGWNMDDQKTRDQALKLLYGLKSNVFEAGDKAEYCGSGFLLASEIVSKISRVPFAEFAKSEIFEPLGMKNTVFGNTEGVLIHNRARFYSRSGDGFKNESLNYYNLTDFSLYSSVEDMALWMLNFETPKIGTPALIKKMHLPAILNNGTTSDVVIGQYISSYKGLSKLQQHGRSYGNTTYVAYFPDQDFGIVVLGNAMNFQAKEAALKITDLFLDKEFKIVKNGEEKIVDQKTEFIELSNTELEKYSGSYWNKKSSYSRKIHLKGNKLFYHRSEGNESELTPIAQNTFVLTQQPEAYTIRFENRSGKELMIFAVGEEFEYFNEKYDPITYDLKQLKEFTGTFLCKDLSVIYNLSIEDSALTVSHSRKVDFVISPYKVDKFTSSVSYFGNLEYERDNKGKILGFWIRTSDVGNIFFNKIL